MTFHATSLVQLVKAALTSHIKNAFSKTLDDSFHTKLKKAVNQA